MDRYNFDLEHHILAQLTDCLPEVIGHPYRVIPTPGLVWGDAICNQMIGSENWGVYRVNQRRVIEQILTQPPTRFTDLIRRIGVGEIVSPLIWNLMVAFWMIFKPEISSIPNLRFDTIGHVGRNHPIFQIRALYDFFTESGRPITFDLSAPESTVSMIRDRLPTVFTWSHNWLKVGPKLHLTTGIDYSYELIGRVDHHPFTRLDGTTEPVLMITQRYFTKVHDLETHLIISLPIDHMAHKSFSQTLQLYSRTPGIDHYFTDQSGIIGTYAWVDLTFPLIRQESDDDQNLALALLGIDPDAHLIDSTSLSTSSRVAFELRSSYSVESQTRHGEIQEFVATRYADKLHLTLGRTPETAIVIRLDRPFGYRVTDYTMSIDLVAGVYSRSTKN